MSQCCSLRYSFNFSHKCPELVGPSSRFSLLQSYAKTRITILITALHSGQLPSSSATRRPQFSQNLACPQGTKAKPSMGANKHTSTLRPFALVPVHHFPILQIPVTPRELQTSRLGLVSKFERLVSTGEANVSVSSRSRALTFRAHP